MKTYTKISSLQFYLLLFLSRSVIVFSINSQTVGEGNFLDNILSSILLMVTLFVLVFPFYKMRKLFPDQSLLSIAESTLGNIGKAVSVIYGIFFLLINTISLSLFLTLIINTMNPSASRWSIAAVLVSIALFGAIKGIETITRTSICIFFLFLSGFILIFITLIPHFEMLFSEPLLHDGTDHLIQGYLYFFSHCSSVAEIAVLIPYVRNDKYVHFTIWNTCVTLFVSALLLFVVCVLGEYAYLQIFPVYTLSTMAEIAGIQRLDALVIGLSMTALVVRLSCGLFVIGECCSEIKKIKSKRWVISVSSFIIFCLSLWITGNSERTGFLFHIEYILPFTVLVSAILPVIIMTVTSMKRRRSI